MFEFSSGTFSKKKNIDIFIKRYINNSMHCLIIIFFFFFTYKIKQIEVVCQINETRYFSGPWQIKNIVTKMKYSPGTFISI